MPSTQNIIFASKSDDIRDLINVCDVFVSLGTTATVDAMIAKKLIICPILVLGPGVIGCYAAKLRWFLNQVQI